MESQIILDEMIAEDPIEILKAAMPYLPKNGQRFASVYAKVLELQGTIRLFSQPSTDLKIQSRENTASDPVEMLAACSKVCHGHTKEKIDAMLNTLAMFQIFELSQERENQKV